MFVIKIYTKDEIIECLTRFLSEDEIIFLEKDIVKQDIKILDQQILNISVYNEEFLNTLKEINIHIINGLLKYFKKQEKEMYRVIIHSEFSIIECVIADLTECEIEFLETLDNRKKIGMYPAEIVGDIFKVSVEKENKIDREMNKHIVQECLGNYS